MISSYQRRYFQNTDSSTGEKLFWHGKDETVPFRGASAPNLKQEEFEQLKLVYDSNTRILDLDNPEELAFYNMIIDQCAKGCSVLRKELVHPTDKSWRVFLQWFDMSKELEKHNVQLGAY